jgi:N-acetylmuramoyl-L-alanine amidase
MANLVFLHRTGPFAMQSGLPVYQNAFTDFAMKIAIVVGHNAKAPGAYAPTPIGLSEFEFNNLVADEMVRLSRDNLFNLFKGGRRLELVKVNRTAHTSYSAEIDAAYDQVDALQADASVELHFNEGPPNLVGTETFCSGSAKSFALANYVHDSVVKVLYRPDRGVKVLGPAERGGRGLHSGRATAILVEPFFATNSVDLAAAQRVGIQGLAKAYMEGLLAYASSLQHDAGGGAAPLNPRNVFGTLKLETKNLTKEEFFSRNQALLALAVENINHIQHERAHGEYLVPLTLVDALCLMNAEMGLRGAYVDPKHVHSEKEVGLLPLPANLVYWNGEDAPLDHSRLSPEENVSEFLLYLSGIKNKPVGRPFAWGEFYTDLFRHPSTINDERAQMHLLAAVVHGWFIRELYRGNPNFGSIAANTAIAYQDPGPVLEELRYFGYKNAIAGDGSIVRNRIANLNSIIPLAMPATVPAAPVMLAEGDAPAEATEPAPKAESKPEPAPVSEPTVVAEPTPEIVPASPVAAKPAPEPAQEVAVAPPSEAVVGPEVVVAPPVAPEPAPAPPVELRSEPAVIAGNPSPQPVAGVILNPIVAPDPTPGEAETPPIEPTPPVV